jgi:hypothetical protein
MTAAAAPPVSTSVVLRRTEPEVRTLSLPHRRPTATVAAIRAVVVSIMVVGSVFAPTAHADSVKFTAIAIPGYEKPDAFALSADGQVVVFQAAPVNAPSSVQILAYERRARRLEVISVGTDGKQGDAASGRPAVSADGRYVAFPSSASNLVRGDHNDVADIFVRDRNRKLTERVNLQPGGKEVTKGATIDSSPVVFKQVGGISGDGRTLMFAGQYGDLNGPGEDRNNITGFLVDRQTHTLQRILGPDGHNASVDSPALSADGSVVAFATYASLTREDLDDCRDVYLFSAKTKQFVLVTTPGSAESATEPVAGAPIAGAEACNVAPYTRLGGPNGLSVDARGMTVALTGQAEMGYWLMSDAGMRTVSPPPTAQVSRAVPLLMTRKGRVAYFLAVDPTQDASGDALYSLDLSSGHASRVTGALDACPSGACGRPANPESDSGPTSTSDAPRGLSASADGKVVAFAAFLSLAPGAPSGQQTAYFALLP